MPNLMETYELVNELDNEAVSIIEEFMDGFQAALLENGYFACGDDRACVLANAVAKYVKDCNPILFTEPQEPRPRCLYCKS